jgi:hypothetical protein
MPKRRSNVTRLVTPGFVGPNFLRLCCCICIPLKSKKDQHDRTGSPKKKRDHAIQIYLFPALKFEVSKCGHQTLNNAGRSTNNKKKSESEQLAPPPAVK